MASNYFTPINEVFGDDVARWEAASPVSMARAYSNPIVLTHHTCDVLVPVDQMSKTYSYDFNDGTLPRDFLAQMGDNYPGILSKSFEEMADPEQFSIQEVEYKDDIIKGDLPHTDKLISVYIIDDGPITAKASHNAPNVVGSLDNDSYLEEIFSKTLKNTEVLVPEKLLLLLDRYAGNSIALPAHEGVDDEAYGSLTVYKEEVVDELKMWVSNHSYSELEQAIESAIEQETYQSKQDIYQTAWQELKAKL